MGTASGAQDVGQLDVGTAVTRPTKKSATGRGGFSLTFLIAPLPCRNKDFRTRGTAVTRPIEDRLLFPLESPPAVPIT